MSDRWTDRLQNFVQNAEEFGVYELVQKVGNPASAKSTVYQLAKKFPDFVWKHDGELVKVFLPQAKSLKDLAREKWTRGAQEHGNSDAWPPNVNDFVGEPYKDSLEELADLYNYTVVAQAKHAIADSEAEEILQAIHALYNRIRYANEYLDEQGFRRTD